MLLISILCILLLEFDVTVKSNSKAAALMVTFLCVSADEHVPKTLHRKAHLGSGLLPCRRRTIFLTRKLKGKKKV